MELPLKHVAIVGGYTISVIRALIVELEQDGLRGYGEVYEDKRFEVSLDSVINYLLRIQEPLNSYALADPTAFGRFINEQLPDANKAALCALEMAACDLWGKMLNRPLWRLWKLNPQKMPYSSHTITLDSVFRMIEKYSEFPDYPVYRLKLGSSYDMDIVRELRRKTSSPFRLDVNGAWSVEQTLKYLPELEKLNVELIEQPINKDDWKGMAILKKKSSIPLFADESCRGREDLKKCAEYFNGVNLKPMKFGGLYPTLNAIDQAKKLGLLTMIGNTFESTIAASAISQFAPVLDYIYIDGPMLVDRRVGSGVQLEQGKIILSKEHGSGIHFSIRQFNNS